MLAVASSVLAFAVGCGGGSHEHSYKSKSDSQYHWQECECGDKKSTFSHVDEIINGTGEAGADGKCDVCGATVLPPHEHAYTELKSDAAEHWYECECGEKNPARAPEAHVDTKDNETEEAGADDKCDVCGASVHFVHKYTELKSDAEKHWYECACGEKDPTKEPEAHVDTINAETGKADDKCDVCGADFHMIHDYTILKHDIARHWYECRCGEIDEDTIEEHYTEGEDNKCDVCGEALHEHTYTIKKFDDDEHWNECVCGKKDSIGIHVDAIDNETDAEGKDGKCDVCGYVFKFAVTFNMGGIGDTPVAQEVLFGGYVTKPQTPVAPKGSVFEDWYADSKFVTPFDFENMQITSDTVIYAKWVVTPGSSKESAIAIIKDSEEGISAFGEFDKLYLKYTASAQSRLIISLITYGPSAKCTFTTGIDGDQTVYAVNDDLYFDLERNETIYITVLRGDGVTDAQSVAMYLRDSTDEPFPEEGWVTGEYTNGSVTLVFDKEKQTASYNGGAATRVGYVGGKHAHATFTASLYGEDTICTLTQTQEDVLQLTATTAYGALNLTLNRVVPQDPIDISKFSGIYRLAGVSNVPSEFGIYENGNGYYIYGGYKYRQTLGSSGSSFNQKKNTLTYAGQYNITVNLDEDGNAASIYVNGVEYPRVGDSGDEVPEILPLPSDIELTGETISIICQYGMQHWKDNYSVEITGYVKATGIYTVKDDKTVYTLEIEGEGDDVVVKVFDETHTNLLDTLSKKVVQLKELNLDGSDNEIALEDVSNYFAIFTVPASGTYLFSVTNMNPSMRYDIYVYTDYVNQPYSSFNLSSYNTNTKISLKEGDQFAINLAEYGSTFRSLTFTLTEDVADPGTSPDNPFKIVGVGSQEITALKTDTSNDYYVRFTASEAGEYHITCSTLQWGQTNYKVSYTVDGVTSGYVPEGYYFGYYYRDGVELGDMYSAENAFKEAPYATVHVEAGQTVMIVVNRKDQSGGVDKVVVSVEKA